MSLPDESARRAAWSAYWATGGLHSCVGSFGGNYGGAIGGFWREGEGPRSAGYNGNSGYQIKALPIAVTG